MWVQYGESTKPFDFGHNIGPIVATRGSKPKNIESVLSTLYVIQITTDFFHMLKENGCVRTSIDLGLHLVSIVVTRGLTLKNGLWAISPQLLDQLPINVWHAVHTVVMIRTRGIRNDKVKSRRSSIKIGSL